jgi:hypothetical protein
LQSGWRPEVAKGPFSQQTSMANRVAYAAPSSLMQSQVTAANLIPPQQPASASSMAQQVAAATMPTYSLPPMTTVIPEKQLHSVHQRLPSNSSTRQTPHSAALRIQSTSNGKPAPVYVTLNAPSRSPASFPSHPLSQSLHPSTILSEPRLPAPHPVSDSWRASQGQHPNYHSQANQNNYNALVRGSRQPLLQPGPPWERNEYVVEEEFESWSPENSPTRTSDYMLGRNLPYSEPRTNPGWNSRPDRPRQRNISGYRDQSHNRYGDRKWRDRRH